MLRDVLGRQQGVISWRQAIAAGVTESTIRANVRAGRWRRVLPGVYATFTGPLPRAAQLWAVVLRAGRGAVLSHHTAAELNGLVDKTAAAIHVTVPVSRRLRPIPGVVLHYAIRAALIVQPGPELPRTRVEETVVDLTQAARTLDEAVGWVTTACGRRLTTTDRILAAVKRRKKLRWRRLLLAVLDDTAAGCHSVLERHYLRSVERAHRLPCGRRQAVQKSGGARRYEDVRYDEYASVVELDGSATHPEEVRRRDRLRDNESAATGTRVLRYGWSTSADPAQRQSRWPTRFAPAAEPAGRAAVADPNA